MGTTLQLPVQLSFTLTVDLETGTFHDLQRDLRRESRRALLQALQGSLERVERALLSGPVECPQCAGTMRSRGRNLRRLVTVFGPVDIRRRRYGCRTCHTVRRPLDEWLRLLDGTEYTTAVREQALFLAAELPYERAAEALRHVGGIGMSGRQIQHLLEEESTLIATALGGTSRGSAGTDEAVGRRFRRGGRHTATPGAQRVSQLRRLKTSGLWDQYWARRFEQERSLPRVAGQSD
jgi:hypothetical protein